MKILVLGLGNILCGDDGLGSAVVAEVERDYELPENVELVDGGTLGLALLPLLQDTDVAIFVDAIRDGDAAAGTFVRIDGSAVLPAVRDRLSVHQIGVADLLDAARLTGRYPPELILLGLVPATLALGLGLSEEVRRNVPRLVGALRDELTRLGAPPVANEARRAG